MCCRITPILKIDYIIHYSNSLYHIEKRNVVLLSLCKTAILSPKMHLPHSVHVLYYAQDILIMVILISRFYRL